MDKKTFLVVDDEPIICNLLAKIFDHLGYKYYLANNSLSAVETLKEHLDEIDIAIVDLIMPETDGLETIKNLKEIKGDLIALLSSGQSENSFDNANRTSAVDGFLSKPYRVEHLTAVLKEYLDKS